MRTKCFAFVSFLAPLILVASMMAGEALPTQGEGLKKEFQAIYDRQAEFTMKRDVKGLMDLNAADYSVKLRDGKSMSREDLEKRLTFIFTSGIIVRQISYSYTVTEVTAQANEAVVLVEQKDKRIQKREGKEQEIEADVIHRDTWKRTPQGWKRRLTEEMKQTKFTVDGKAVELPKK